jgi:hypothetical protein
MRIPANTSPQGKEAFEEIAGFFDKHLGNRPPME